MHAIILLKLASTRNAGKGCLPSTREMLSPLNVLIFQWIWQAHDALFRDKKYTHVAVKILTFSR